MNLTTHLHLVPRLRLSGAIPLLLLSSVMEWDINRLMFVDEILRKIFGPNNESGIWRIKTNQELDEIIKRKNIRNFLRAQRLSWLGHIERMQDTRMVKAIYSWKPISRRPIGRPKTRWVDDARKDIQKLKVPNWKTLAQDRGKWKELVEKAKTL